jgi:hypothetical protein
MDRIKLAQSRSAVFHEHNYEKSGSVKGGKFLDQLCDYQIVKKDCVPLSCLLTC